MPRMTGNRYFAEALQAYDVKALFFVPTMMIPAMAEMEGMGIQRIVTHGEKAAAYMADGYARAARKPGVCLAQDIGSTNLAAGLRDAYMACSPVIAITGGQDNTPRYRHAYQNLEDYAVWDYIAKANFRVDTVERFPDILRQTFRVATTGAPGPVHIETRGNHGQVLEDEGDLNTTFEKQFISYPAFRPEADPALVRAAADLLAQASKPVIMAGGGVTASSAGPEVVKLAETLQIPVATAMNAKEIISDDHPLAVGVPGTYSRKCANEVIAEADLVFFIGSHSGGQATHFWRVPAEGARTIQLDIDPEELGRNYPNEVSLCGDAKATLQRLLEVAKPGASRQAWVERAQSLVRDYWAKEQEMYESDATPMRPERICKEISEWLPQGGVLVSDTGHAGMWTSQMIRITRPGQRFLRCAGSLGWGFPATLGAKTALPDSPVVCFTGDGGFYYHIAELETAARFGINAIIVVNNNFALNQEEHIFDDAYGGNQRGGAYDMWHFRQEADLAKVAEAMGCVGMRVEKPGDIKPALDKAMAAGRPVVLDVISDVNAMAERAFVPAAAVGAH